MIRLRRWALAALLAPAFASGFVACSDGASLGGDLNEAGAGARGEEPGGDDFEHTGGSRSFGGSSSFGGSGGASGAGASSAGATPSFGGAGTECFPTARTPEDDRVNASALETAADARPDTLVPVLLSLTDPPFDFSRLGAASDAERPAIIAEREAQLAPYQDPIEALLAAHGAERINSLWLINLVGGSIPAQHVAKIVCWPEVRRIELDASYWDLVEPPWSPTEAGAGECPIVDGGCPARCVPLQGGRYDAANACHEPLELVACSRREVGGSPGVISCSVRVSTGETYVFPGEAPRAPEFLDFRRCTDEEQSLVSVNSACD